MSLTERFLYLLEARDDASPAIDRTSARALSLGGAVDKVKTSFASLGAAAKGFGERFGPAAGAISGVGAALTATGGPMAKFVGGASQAAAAYGAGGPWAAAMVGGTLLIDEYIKTQEASTKALGVWRQQAQLATPLQKAYADSVKAIADEAKRMSEAVEDAGKHEFQVRIARATALKTELELNLANIDANARLTQASVNTAANALERAKTVGQGVDEATEAYELQISVQNRIAANAESYRAQIVSLEASVWKIADAWAAVGSAPTRSGGAAAMAANDDQAVFDDSSFGGTTIEAQREIADRRFLAQEAARDREAQALAAAQNREIESERLKQEQILANEKTFADQTYAQRKAANEAQGALAEQWIGSAAAGLTTLTAELISGQEDALARFGLSIMAQAGQSLIASGTKLGGEAVVSSLTPGLQGLAVAQGTAAAGLIGSGVALGGVAGGLSGLLGGGGGGGGARTAAAPRVADEAPRFASRGGGGSAGGGPTFITVYGGVSGPTADQGARASVDAWRRARARGEAA
jgi:hypothetical protein